MTQTRIVIASLGVAVLLALAPSTAAAQGRGRAVHRAVPRGSVRVIRPVAPYRPYYYAPYRNYYGPYRSGVNLGFYYGYPYFYGYPSYAYPYAYPAYPYPAYGYPGYGYPGYGYSGYVGVRPYGGVRIDLPQRDAEVYVDGYYAGIVDQYDGALQQLNLEAGPHHIEVRSPGFETIAFDVNITPGRTITYRASMRPANP